MNGNRDFQDGIKNLSESLIKMHVASIVNKEERKKVSNDQKNQMKEIVRGLQDQVNTFLAERQQKASSDVNQSEEVSESPLRKKFKY